MSLGRTFSMLTGFGPDTRVFDFVARRYRAVFDREWCRSYSQFGEDVVLASIFGARVPNYVDVGSGDPRRGSNTYGFYRRGGRGICIDAIAENVENGRRLRPEDRHIHALAGRAPGVASFSEYASYEYSTTSRERVVELQKMGLSPHATYELPVMAVSQLGVKAQSHQASLLCIDVEGAEMEVLGGVDWAAYSPEVICIEEWSNPVLEATGVSEVLNSHDYVLYSYIGLSSLYVHSQSAILRS